MATDPKSPRHFEDLLAETRWLGRLAAQLVPPADRDDLVQDVLVSAMRTQKPRHLRHWLSTVARNLAARRRSREINRRSREQTVAREESSEPSAADALEAFASHRAVVNAVMDLDEPYRTAVLLRFWEDLPPREVARRTNVPVETARTRIKRGVDRLRALLDDRSGGRSAWLLPLLQIGGVREAFLAGSAAAGTMTSFPILAGALAMKKVALATVAVASIVATVAVFTYGDGPVQEWPGSSGTGTQHAGATTVAGTDAGGEGAVPSADRTALEHTATLSAGLVVTVLDRFGKPAEGATVWQWRDLETAKAPIEKRATGAQGRVRLASATCSGGIVVLAKDHVVAVRRLPSLAGEHEVRLQAGARVQGWIRVDGKDPAEPIPLRLEGQASHDPLREVPARLRQIVTTFQRENYRVIRTTAHGAFEFTGVSKEWRGSILLPMFLWLRGVPLAENGSPRHYALGEPKTGLQVDTTALPGLRCHVVWDDTGEGVSKPRVMTLAVLPSGTNTPSTGVWDVDEDGYFRVGFGPSGTGYEAQEWANAKEREPIRQIQLWISKDGSNQHVVVDPAKLDPPGYMEIRLKRAIRLHFLAVDPDGQPVPGAVLSGTRRSEPSEADGHGTVEVKETGRRRFLAAAPGHMVAEVEARAGVGTAESPLEFVLPKSNKVVVVVRGANGQPPRGLSVSVRSRQPLFTGPEEGGPSGLHGVVGSSFDTGVWGHKMDFEYPLNEAGEVVLGSLRPKVPFQLVVLDKIHQDALVRDTVSPSAEGVERIELRLEEKIRDLTGVVVDVQDQPIPQALVSVTVGGRGNSCDTDAHGRFRFEDVYPTGKPLTLKLSRRGSLRTERKDVVITKGMEPIRIRLLPGYDVKVTFVDPEGKRLPVMSWLGVEGSPEVESERLEPGLRLVKDLPAGPQVLTVDIGGRRYELQHDPAASNAARFVLPAMGRIQIEIPRPAANQWNELRAVITAGSDGKSFETWFIAGADEPTIRTSERLLLPGRYTVEVRVWAAAGFQVLHPARQVTIKPGKLTLCRFGER